MSLLDSPVWQLLDTPVIHGDNVVVMADMSANTFDAVVCDPPYGLEFMGRSWDRLDGWRDGGGFSESGLGDRPTKWTSFGGKDTANATCATCGGRMRGAWRCECEDPDWRVKRAPLSGQPGYVERGRITKRPDSQVPYGRGGGVNSYQAGKPMQAWHERWAREALRVLKPGGHLFAFGGTRTVHRLGCALEDAGFEIRDRMIERTEDGAVETLGPELHWLYGSGFPKSMDVSKAIDKAAGAERSVVGQRDRLDQSAKPVHRNGYSGPMRAQEDALDITAPATPEAEEWDGWGTALKPAYEPILIARKPIPTTVTANVLRHGTGALNIDACRVGTTGGRSVHAEGGETSRGGESAHAYGNGLNGAASAPLVPGLGRWPANVLLRHTEGCERVGTKRVRTASGTSLGDPAGKGIYNGSFPRGDGRDVGYGDEDGLELVEAWDCAPGCPVAELDAQTGTLTSGANPTARRSDKFRATYSAFEGQRACMPARGADAGGGSRFYYCSKASTAERNAGLDGFEPQPKPKGMHSIPSRQCNVCGSRAKPPGANPEPWPSCGHDDWTWQDAIAERTKGEMRNTHPTVKPIELMRWLLRLAVRKGGLVLDPFGGSGTTVCAGALEEITVVAIEEDAESVAIARARAAWWARQPPHTPVEVILGAEMRRQAVAAVGQDSLFA